MKNINRIIILILAVLMGCIIMVGCGSNSTSNVNGNEVNIKQEDKEYDVQIEASEKTNDEINPNADFRNSSWGDGIEDVKKSEKLSILEEDSTGLMYTGYKLSNMDSDIVYYFDDKNGLYMSGYSIKEIHSNTSAYVDDYYKLQNLLTDKYGEGKEYVRWLSDFYEKTPEYYGAAISTGDLALNTEWSTDNTHILLSLYGDNYILKTTITYINKSYEVSEDTSGL